MTAHLVTPQGNDITVPHSLWLGTFLTAPSEGTPGDTHRAGSQQEGIMHTPKAQ